MFEFVYEARYGLAKLRKLAVVSAEDEAKAWIKLCSYEPQGTEITHISTTASREVAIIQAIPVCSD
jgi:hypothetical protein